MVVAPSPNSKKTKGAAKITDMDGDDEEDLKLGQAYLRELKAINEQLIQELSQTTAQNDKLAKETNGLQGKLAAFETAREGAINLLKKAETDAAAKAASEAKWAELEILLGKEAKTQQNYDLIMQIGRDAYNRHALTGQESSKKY